MSYALLTGLMLLAPFGSLTHVGSLTEELRSPARVAVAPDGTVLVTDGFQDHVARFDAAGTFLDTWSIPAGPIGIAAHPTNGNYYVSLRDEAKVAIYDSSFVFTGSYLGDVSDPVVTFIRPTDIDIDAVTGNIYVVDADADRVYGFSADGALTTLILGTRGGGSSQFRYPSALAIDEAASRLIVADHDNFRIQTFSTGGIFETQFGYYLKFVPGTSEGWMPRTLGVTVGPDSRIYVADAFMGTVRVFEPDGVELEKSLDYGFDPGDLRTPCDLALSNDGLTLYVVNTGASAVEMYAVPDWDLIYPEPLRGPNTGDGPPGTNVNEYDARRLGQLTPIDQRKLPNAPTRRMRKNQRDGELPPSLPPGDSAQMLGSWDGPHMADSDVICGRCHGIPDMPGGGYDPVEGQVNMCLSCHTVGGQALEVPVHGLDVADPYGTNPSAADGLGVSHAWGVPAVNPDADSVGPTPGGVMDRQLDGGNLNCTTCHNQHNTFYAPYLRLSNRRDAMCKECHAPRNEGLGELGTHPVGFEYPGGTGEFPADVAPLLIKELRVECLTCHGMHNVDSGGANAGAGDGRLLRAANDETLCQTCHTEHAVHNPAGDWQPTCQDCHDTHDPASVNLSLVATSVHNQTLGVDKPVVFTARTGPGSFDDGDTTYDGICQVCHTDTHYHMHDGSTAGHFDGDTCTSCHPHDEGFMPTGGACDTCHGQPPAGDTFPDRAGSHATHMSAPQGPGISSCFVCHATLSGTHINDVVSFASGDDVSGDGDIDLSETDVCDACHSPDGPFDGVTEAKGNWAASTPVSCEGCHDTGTSAIQGVAAPAVAGDGTTWGYFTTGHGRGQMVGCTDCHDAATAHFDGVAHSYQAAADNYQAAFRLKSVGANPPLVVPRTGYDWDDAYSDPPYWELCFSCHDRYALFGGPTAPPGPYYADEYGTNFRSEDSVIIPDGFDTDIAQYSMSGAANVNSHYTHMAGPPHLYDSDRDGAVDSYGTCVACHNVHGGTSAAMIRDGKLIGAEPALDFSYVRYDRHESVTGCPDSIVMTSAGGVPLTESHGGVMRAESGPAANGVCNFCHGGGPADDPEYSINCFGPDAVDYYRVPVDIPGACMMCHGRAVDNGDGVPPEGRRAVGGEFPASDAHAHYGATLDSDACTLCHDMTTHMDGYVDLIDADDGSLYTFIHPEDLASDPDVSNFCAGCHDDDGATRLASPFDPFGDGNVPPDVATRFQGTLQWNEWYGDTCFGEEGTLRAVNSHHDIGDADQAFSGARLECLNCHGAHTSSASQPTVDPFAATTPWSGSENAFCLSCHDGGNGPDDPDFPPTVLGPTVPLRGLDTCDYIYEPWYVDYTWTHEAHGLDSKRGWTGYSGAPGHEVSCMDCHDPHGSYSATNPGGNPYMIRDVIDGTMYVDDGVRPGAQWTGPPWDTFGVLRADVVVAIDEITVDWGGPSSLCSACHANWQDAYSWHDFCTGCQSCHGHGQAWGGSDWGDPPDDSTYCPIPAPISAPPGDNDRPGKHLDESDVTPHRIQGGFPKMGDR